ncbi:MAG TPA: EamA family transporter, partial [Solirubrobacteraceae bacterium]
MAETRSGVGAAPVGLVLGAVSSLQFGAAWAKTLFDEVGPIGAVLLRLGFAAVVLVAVWRPRVRGLSRSDWRLVAVFGVVLGAMNAAIYASFDRIPLGVAVTLEFVGPLGVAVAGSRRPLDLLWVGLAAAGIALLGGGGGLGSRLDLLGVVFALVAGGCWAGYILLGVRVGAAFGAG